MLYDLTFERGFSDSAARDVLRQFRATVSYARLAESDDILLHDESESDEDGITDEELSVTTPATLTDPGTGSGTKSRNKRTVQITYSPSEWALLQGQFPMSEADWDAMIAVLQAMKRGLVESDSVS